MATLERRSTVFVLNGWISPAGGQCLHASITPQRIHGFVQRGPAVRVPNIWIGTRFKQRVHPVREPKRRCFVKRCAAVLVSLLWIANQRLDHRLSMLPRVGFLDR